MFWALNGATRTPRRASSRHRPVTTVLFPASLAVPQTMSPPWRAGLPTRPSIPPIPPAGVWPAPLIGRPPGRVAAGPGRRRRGRRSAPCQPGRSWRSPARRWPAGQPLAKIGGGGDQHPVGVGRRRPVAGCLEDRDQIAPVPGDGRWPRPGVGRGEQFGQGGGGQSVEGPLRLAPGQARGERSASGPGRSRRAARGRPAAW